MTPTANRRATWTGKASPFASLPGNAEIMLAHS